MKNVKTKICSKCQIEKSLTAEYFYRDCNQKNGFTCRCKPCLEIYSKRYRMEHKEEITKGKRIHYAKNKSQILAKYKEYRKINREAIKLRQQLYQEKNRDKIKEKKKEYHIKHREYIIQKSIKWAQNNKAKRKKYMKAYCAKNLEYKKEYDKKRRRDNLDFLREQGRLYYQNNKEKVNNLNKKRKKNNPSYKIACNLRSRLWQLLKMAGGKRTDHTKKLVCCSWYELIIHLEASFLDGMSWKNYGRQRCEWSVDHIIPCAVFDLTKPEDQRKCFHYTNLRPCWNEEQWNKNSWYDGKYVRKNNA